jgi:hypothetical protein
MKNAFHRSLFPGIATVCGVELPPLTLWRMACLQAVESPFISPDSATKIDLAALLLAVRVVRAGNLEAPDLRVTFRDKLTYWRHKKNRAYFESNARAFVDWLNAHSIRPELWQDDDGETGRQITAPYLVAQVVALMSCGMAHVEAWNTVPGYADWLILAKAERECDRVKFHDDTDDEINAEVDAMNQRSEAEIIAQAKADLSQESFNRWLSARQSRT